MFEPSSDSPQTWLELNSCHSLSEVTTVHSLYQRQGLALSVADSVVLVSLADSHRANCFFNFLSGGQQDEFMEKYVRVVVILFIYLYLFYLFSFSFLYHFDYFFMSLCKEGQTVISYKNNRNKDTHTREYIADVTCMKLPIPALPFKMHKVTKCFTKCSRDLRGMRNQP